MATVGQPGAVRRITVHYANSGDGNIDEGFIEFLQDQEGMHRSILEDGRATAPSDHGESSTGAASAMDAAQIASDFEFALRLQEMEDFEGDDITCVNSPSDSDDDHEHNEEEADSQDANDDPDNMTYEERQALVESVGSESRGLSDELISYLDRWKYKSGFFSRKPNHDDCPICMDTFGRGDILITLPCKHEYHARCITKWLKTNKTCPVCKYEVFGPS
ncbi:hypothetical protein ACP4OV_017143 [Aristida adscensionis]